ncbi:MAG TPA: hypothetical protein VEB21_00840 [Terriglobales bacterium]|nr:hypothetical protein [Terriglobales bacterium]
MAESLQPCCQRTRRDYIRRIAGAIFSFPLIKSIPCPTCNRVIAIRLYEPPEDVDSAA